MRISDWSSDVCSSDLQALQRPFDAEVGAVETSRGTDHLEGVHDASGVDGHPRRVAQLVAYDIGDGVEDETADGRRVDRRAQGPGELEHDVFAREVARLGLQLDPRADQPEGRASAQAIGKKAGGE